MKNIIGEKPTDVLHGRTLYCTRFVTDDDIQNKQILDIGCGYGWLELNLFKRGAEHVTGIEISDMDLETARKHINCPTIDFQCGSAIDLPFEQNRFDTVVSWEVIEHIPRNTEQMMFHEVCRVLKMGGCFYMSTPYNCFTSNILDPAWWLIGHRHYSIKKLEVLASASGLTIEKLVLNGRWWEIIATNNLYISKWIFRRKPFLKQLIDRRQDAEYAAEDGFTNIFVKFRKHKQ